MMTYDEWYELYMERVYNWTEDVRYLIYQCWSVGINVEWVIANLCNNEYVAIYQKFLTCAKQVEPNEKITNWISLIRKDLYYSYIRLIEKYCID